MNSVTNKLIIRLQDFPDLMGELSRLKPGEEVEFEIKAALDDSLGNSSTFSIKTADIVSDTAEETGKPEEGNKDPDDELSDEAMPGKKSASPGNLLTLTAAGRGGS